MHLHTTINMVALHSGNRDSVVSMDSQVETMSAPNLKVARPQRLASLTLNTYLVKGRVERPATTSTSATGMLKV